jgi:hypothetical protein
MAEELIIIITSIWLATINQELNLEKLKIIWD